MGRDEEDRSPLGKNLVTEQMLIRDRKKKKSSEGICGIRKVFGELCGCGNYFSG